MKFIWGWAGSALFGVGMMLVVSPLIANGRSAIREATMYEGQAASQGTPSANAGPMLDGPTLFRERGCAQCHEIRGVGGNKGPDLSGVGRRMKKDIILKQIEEGGDAMPPFGGVIAENEIAVLVKYLEHCKDKTKAKKAPVVAALAE